MKNSFWISLFLFCLLMCSCRSKKVVSEIATDSKHVSEVSYMGESSKIDTTKTIHSEQLKEHKIIKETITEIEYDTDKNVVKKTTTTERTIAQGLETDITEEVQNRIGFHLQDSLNHSEESHDMIESEVKEETEGGQEALGKWLGIVIGLFISGFIIYLLRKLRIN